MLGSEFECRGDGLDAWPGIEAALVSGRIGSHIGILLTGWHTEWRGVFP